MKKTLIALLLLSSTAIFSQSKMDALRAYFDNKNVVCDSAGTVVFYYKGGTINRATDGGQTYETILKNGGAFQDAVSYGVLKEIVLNGKTVKGYGQTGGKQVEPLFKEQDQPRRTFASMVNDNDSTSVKQQLDGIKRGYDDATDFAEKFWSYFFEVFDYAKWIFYGVGAVALYFALVGKTEYTHTGKWQDKAILWIQRMSSLILFIDVTVIVALYLIQAILEMKDWDLPVPIVLLMLYLVVQVLAWLTSWLIPNATVNNGGFGYKRNNDNRDNDFKQLR